MVSKEVVRDMLSGERVLRDVVVRLESLRVSREKGGERGNNIKVLTFFSQVRRIISC